MRTITTPLTARRLTKMFSKCNTCGEPFSKQGAHQHGLGICNTEARKSTLALSELHQLNKRKLERLAAVLLRIQEFSSEKLTEEQNKFITALCNRGLDIIDLESVK